MNPQQLLTIKRMAVAGVLFFTWLLYVLTIEIQAVRQGGNSTISEMIWRLWADQAWVIFIICIVINSIVFFLLGHFTAQSNVIYKLLR